MGVGRRFSTEVRDMGVRLVVEPLVGEHCRRLGLDS
jgi:hypothetical protein